MFYAALGTRLRRARQEEGLRQEDMGRLLGITAQSYARYESGERSVSAEDLQRIAGITHRPVSWFFGVGEEREAVVFGYHIERLPPEDYKLLKDFVRLLFTRQRESSAS